MLTEDVLHKAAIGILSVLISATLLSGIGAGAYIATSNIVYSTNTVLSANIINCISLTVDAGVALTTNGYYITCVGNFINNGEIITGNPLNGGAAGSRGADYPNSFGGSGGGSGGTTLAAGLFGGNTIIPGGAGGALGGSGGNGSTPPAPAVTNANIITWSGLFSNYLTGAGGSGSSSAIGGNGAYGLYIQANQIIAGGANAIGTGGGNGALLSSAGGGGGGGGFLLFSYGSGGYTAGTYNTLGGTGGNAATGDGAGGGGGSGNAISYSYGTIPPLDILTLPTIAPASPIIADAGQSVQISTSFIGGVSPYTYNYFIVNSITLAQIATQSYSGVPQSSNTFIWSIPSTMQGNVVEANVVVTDTNTANSLGSGLPVNSIYSSTITIHPAPTVSLTPVNPVLDVGQYVTYNAVIPSGVGAGPFTVNLIGSNGATFATNTIGIGGGSALLSFQATSTTPDTFNIIATDTGTTTPFLFNSISNTITINEDPVLAIRPSANSIDVFGNVIMSNTITLGTQPYGPVSYTTNAPANTYAISSNIITFNAIGTFDITGTMKDAANFIVSNTIPFTVNGVITSNTANTVVVLQANVPTNIIFTNTNTVLTLSAINSINVGFFIANVTSTYNTLPPGTISSAFVLNSIISNGGNSITSAHVIAAYPCTFGSNVAPYEFNTVWSAITPFAVNSAACTVSFTVPADPVYGVFQTAVTTTTTIPSGGRSPTRQVVLTDNISNITTSNTTIIRAYQYNPLTGQIGPNYTFFQNQLPATIYPLGNNYVNFSFACSFSAGGISYAYANDIIGIGFYKPCRETYSVVSGSYTLLYRIVAPSPTTTTSTTTSIPTTSVSTTLPTTTTVIGVTTTLPATTTIVTPPAQNRPLPVVVYAILAIVAILVASLIYALMRSVKRRSHHAKAVQQKVQKG